MSNASSWELKKGRTPLPKDFPVKGEDTVKDGINAH